MSTRKSSPVHINISSNDEHPVACSEYNEFRDYVIRNNISLQSDIKLKIEEIKELEAKNMQYEEQEDKYDTRVRYLKGLLQNLNQLRSMYSNIKDKSEQKIEIIRQHNKKSKQIYYEIYAFLIIINIAILLTPFDLEYYNWFTLLCKLSYFAGLPYCVYKIITKYSSIDIISKEATNNMREKTQEINYIKQEIEIIEASCITIDNWIYEI